MQRVTWYGAAQYAKHCGKRLPTEAEWEYACRAGSVGDYCFGSDVAILPEYDWYILNSGGTTDAVGGKLPNEFGLYDMHGNVFEWCSDWYHPWYYMSSPVEDPRGAVSGTYRVLRGGSWNNDDRYGRSADRNYYDPETSYSVIGFRCALSAEAPGL